jgi:hypothetical protein
VPYEKEGGRTERVTMTRQGLDVHSDKKGCDSTCVRYSCFISFFEAAREAGVLHARSAGEHDVVVHWKRKAVIYRNMRHAVARVDHTGNAGRQAYKS